MADSYKINVDTAGLGQYTAHTCWLACASILYRWKKEDPATIPDKLIKAGLPYDRYKTSGLQDSDLVAVGGTLGFMGWNAQAVLAWDLPRFIEQLSRYGPHKVGLKSGSGKHAMVVHGVDVKADQLQFANPWSNIQAGTVETAFLTLQQFRDAFNPVPFSMQSWP
jgi:hypothetical protein